MIDLTDLDLRAATFIDRELQRREGETLAQAIERRRNQPNPVLEAWERAMERQADG